MAMQWICCTHISKTSITEITSFVFDNRIVSSRFFFRYKPICFIETATKAFPVYEIDQDFWLKIHTHWIKRFTTTKSYLWKRTVFSKRTHKLLIIGYYTMYVWMGCCRRNLSDSVNINIDRAVNESKTC